MHLLDTLLDRVHRATDYGYDFGAIVGTVGTLSRVPGYHDLRSHVERIGSRLAHEDVESAAAYTLAALDHIATMRYLGFTTQGLRAVEDGLRDLHATLNPGAQP